MPLFCKKCQGVGHNCGVKPAAPSKVIQRWVPKKVVTVDKKTTKDPPIIAVDAKPIVEEPVVVELAERSLLSLQLLYMLVLIL